MAETEALDVGQAGRPQRLAGKRAIVTGGASGFGLGIAARFAAEGVSVLIADVNGAAADESAQRIAEQTGARVEGVETDVSSAFSVEALREKAEAMLGGLDILVNNAGVGHTPRPMEALDEETFDQIFAVNAKSVYLTAQAFVPALKASAASRAAEGAGPGGAAILNVASTGGVSPRPGLTWYNASKGWMITATRSMAVELAPSGVRVNAINPVAGETPLLKTFMGDDTEEIRAKFLSTIPLGRFSTPADMAAAAAYLCSEDASMVTGVAMEVDGGRCV
ncbi:MAG: glucose 1-dehydrogenase [Pseudomonadota bacterium]